ncbi:MAG: class I SAM-dependent methyltransferase [Candidatus Kerfeldbacteria bacterium]|nr:class I SAM-dependent methyltransferase [Candidatus Kerfeldbacteria bacterium]
MRKPVDDLRKDIVFSAHLRQHEFAFHSTWGLFSPEAIDPGSKLLIDHLDVRPNDTAIDLGCGYGAIGIAVAREASAGYVHLVDKDFIAVEYAKKNIAVNGIANATAYLSNGFNAIPKDQRFDLILSNLPAKVGRELYDIFFLDAKNFLKPGGRIYVVTIAGLKEFIKKNFHEIFGNYDKVKQNGTHVVARAVKRSPS